ncbi:MAG: ATP-binding protein [Lachnospiraceae bacterium]
MKSPITRKLVGYFSAILFIFALVTGISFVILFYHNTIELNKQELQSRTEGIAEKLSGFMQEEKTHKPGKGNGYGAYMKSLDDIARTDVWVVDKNAQTIDMGHGKHMVTFKELPKDANDLIDEVFEGKSALNEGFSDFFKTSTITAGAPVYGKNQMVAAAVLLHADVKGMQHSVWQGIKLLIIVLSIALLGTLIIAIWLAKKFMYPLKSMEQTTKHLIEGDYTAKTGIVQKDEIGSLAQNMDVLSERLEKSSQERQRFDNMQQEFIATVSHELRTPITVIRGSLELLYDGVIQPEEMKTYFGQMLKDSIHLQRLVNDLLELSKLQNEDYRIEMNPLNLVEVVEDAVRSLKPLAKDKEIEIMLDTPADPCVIEGDYGRLRQLCIILLDNAIKFSKEGGKIDVQIFQKVDEIGVDFKDYGSGIAAKDILHIFEKFYHIKSEKNQDGSGLGLAVAKQIAQRHGATLECESQEQTDTTFHFVKKR